MHIFFIFLYLFLPDTISSESLYHLLSIHFAISIIRHLKQNKKAIVTPIFIFYLSTILVNYANVELINSYLSNTLKSSNYLSPQFIHDAARIWCVSCTLIVMGFNFNKWSLPSVVWEITNKNHFKIIFWTILFINVNNLIQYTTGVGFNTQAIKKYFDIINLFSILFFAKLWTKENNKTYGIYAISLCLLMTYIALVSAYMRTNLILPTVSFYIGFFIGKGNLRSVLSYRIVPFLVVAVVFATSFKELQANRANFYDVIFKTSDGSNGTSAADETIENGTGFLERSSNLQQMTSVIRLVNEKGFYNGRASEPLIIAMIPRVIWPDKPMIALGTWFALEIGAAYKNDDGIINNSINMTIPGQFYLDFGWIGVFLGSFLMGMFYRIIWNTTEFYSSEHNITGIIFGGYLFIMLMGNLGGDLQIVITLLSVYVSFYIFSKLMKAK